MNHFAILRSADVPGHLSSDELATYTQRTISRIKQSGNSMPPLLIMHVSSVAALVGVSKTGVIRHNLSGTQELPSYYEIWLVGNAVFTDYVLALQGIIHDVETISGLSQPVRTSGSSSQSTAPDSKATAV